MLLESRPATVSKMITKGIRADLLGGKWLPPWQTQCGCRKKQETTSSGIHGLSGANPQRILHARVPDLPENRSGIAAQSQVGTMVPSAGAVPPPGVTTPRCLR